MKLESGLDVLQETDSTQDVVAARLRSGAGILNVLALHQKRGRGRFGREWHSVPGESFALSLAFPHYRKHDSPWLIGMACAVATAATVHAQVQWPNDVLLAGKKVGGILTEIHSGTPVVGIGLNLRQKRFPNEISERATSVLLHQGNCEPAEELARRLLDSIAELPEPDRWENLQPVWRQFDSTKGKSYRLPSGEEAEALGIGSQGELICSVDGETRTAMAADAIFGATAS